MKAKIVSLITVALVIIVAASLWYLMPKQYSRTLDGVYYQLESEGIIEQVTVRIDGKLRNHIDGKKTFHGVMDIEGDKVPHILEDRTPLEVHYDGHNFTAIFSAFRMTSNGVVKGDPIPYGWLYTNDAFNEFTIKVLLEKSLSEGYMITAPTQNREDAMEMSRELLKGFEEQNADPLHQ